MVSLRSLRWPDDRDALCALDISFTTARVFRIVGTASAFTLNETTVSPPLHKIYNLAGDVEDFPTFDLVLIAEHETQVVGVGALSFDNVDRRAIVKHLYVDRSYREQGIGHALMNAMLVRAQHAQMRCVWLETQDVNHAAIRFYRGLGFEWCGLDRSLDEHDGSASDETAVFFMRTLT